MLKLTYTENSFSLEFLNESLETWVNTRVILALRSGTNIHIESTTAAFLLPADSRAMADLENVAKKNIVELCRCDVDSVEVTLKGYWVTSDATSETGIFVTELSKSAELLVDKLWKSDRCCRV
jgi:hypothetical protein